MIMSHFFVGLLGLELRDHRLRQRLLLLHLDRLMIVDNQAICN